ncbi:MAG TPA: PAS domain-containing protein [Stellaceae bacterium]
MIATKAPKQQEMILGLLFGLTAILGLLVPLKLLPDSVANTGPVAIGLAAAFGGQIAVAVAAMLAAGFRLWFGGGAALAGMVELLAAGLIGLLVTEFLQRRGGDRYRRQVAALALTLPGAVFVGLALRWSAVPGYPAVNVAPILGAGILVGLGSFVFGTLLRHGVAIDDKLAESDRRFQALAANVPGIVFQCIVRPSGEITFPYLSPECAELFNVRPEDVKRNADRVLLMIHPEDAEPFRRSLREAGAELRLWSHDYRIIDWGGNVRWLHGRATPRRLPGGDIVWHGAMVEVTRRKEREEAFRRLEKLYRVVAENTTDIIQLAAADGTRSYVSPSVRQFLGYEAAELVGQRADALVHPADVEIMRSALRQLAVDGKPSVATYRLRRKDGSHVSVTETCRLTDDVEAMRSREIVSVIQATDRRIGGEEALAKAAAERRAVDAPFAKALEAMAAGVLITNPHAPGHPVVFANVAAAAITGYSVGEMMGRDIHLLEGPETDPDAIAAIGQALREERPISATVLSYRRDGKPFWASLHISPIHNAAKRLQAFVAVFFDRGDHREVNAERQIAEFMSNISHELRTPLNGVIGFTDLLLNETLPAEQRRYATFVRDAGRSLLAIINNSLEFANVRTRPDAREVDFSVAELALSCNRVVWHDARRKGLDLNFVMKPDVVDGVRGHPDRIRQAVLDLLGNAVKFTEKGSVVLSVARGQDTPAGTTLSFAVADTGVGIAAEKLRTLFDRPAVAGGLPMCKALIEQMGGRIAVKSTPGAGSEFSFTVPLKLRDDRPATASTSVRKKGRILLAEDTPMNQELVVALLTRSGYEVEVVGDGVAAVEAARQRPFDVLLLDVQMPRLDGVKATEAIRALPNPMGSVPIIAITAKALPKDVERCRAAGMNDHLAKPIDSAALLALVDRWARASAQQVAPVVSRKPTAERSPRLDRSALESLGKHLGAERTAQMVDVAMKEIPERLERMLRQVSDRARITQDAHELLSVAEKLGLADLAGQCRRLGAAPSEADDWQIGVMVENAKTAAERAIAAIRRDAPPHAAE